MIDFGAANVAQTWAASVLGKTKTVHDGCSSTRGCGMVNGHKKTDTTLLWPLGVGACVVGEANAF